MGGSILTDFSEALFCNSSNQHRSCGSTIVDFIVRIIDNIMYELSADILKFIVPFNAFRDGYTVFGQNNIATLQDGNQYCKLTIKLVTKTVFQSNQSHYLRYHGNCDCICKYVDTL